MKPTQQTVMSQQARRQSARAGSLAPCLDGRKLTDPRLVSTRPVTSISRAPQASGPALPALAAGPPRAMLPATPLLIAVAAAATAAVPAGAFDPTNPRNCSCEHRLHRLPASGPEGPPTPHYALCTALLAHRLPGLPLQAPVIWFPRAVARRSRRRCPTSCS